MEFVFIAFLHQFHHLKNMHLEVLKYLNILDFYHVLEMEVAEDKILSEENKSIFWSNPSSGTGSIKSLISL